MLQVLAIEFILLAIVLWHEEKIGSWSKHENKK